MTARLARRRAAILGCAVGVLLAAGCGTSATRPAAPPPSAAQRAREAAEARLPPLRRAKALAVARRFAAAFAAWDAGRRTPQQLRRLAATTTPAVLATLRGRAARPVARPARPLALTLLDAYPDDGGRFRIPLVLAGEPGRQVVTLIIAATSHGPRIVALER